METGPTLPGRLSASTRNSTTGPTERTVTRGGVLPSGRAANFNEAGAGAPATGLVKSAPDGNHAHSMPIGRFDRQLRSRQVWMACTQDSPESLLASEPGGIPGAAASTARSLEPERTQVRSDQPSGGAMAGRSAQPLPADGAKPGPALIAATDHLPLLALSGVDRQDALHQRRSKLMELYAAMTPQQRESHLSAATDHAALLQLGGPALRCALALRKQQLRVLYTLMPDDRPAQLLAATDHVPLLQLDSAALDIALMLRRHQLATLYFLMPEQRVSAEWVAATDHAPLLHLETPEWKCAMKMRGAQLAVLCARLSPQERTTALAAAKDNLPVLQLQGLALARALGLRHAVFGALYASSRQRERDAALAPASDHVSSHQLQRAALDRARPEAD